METGEERCRYFYFLTKRLLQNAGGGHLSRAKLRDDRQQLPNPEKDRKKGMDVINLVF